MSEQKASILQGFKAFLMRGNVVDLAVAVVIGAAFSNIVNSIVKGIINPVVGAIGTKNLDSYYSCIKEPCKGTGDSATGVRIQWGSVLGATLTFVITAAVVSCASKGRPIASLMRSVGKISGVASRRSVETSCVPLPVQST